MGILRFKANAIVRHLLDNGGITLHDIAVMDFSREDREQFAQLIGYSHSGSVDLSYVSDAVWYAAQDEYEARTDAESPAGTSLADMLTINESPCLPDGVVVFTQGGEIKGVMHTIPEKVTTSPPRVQIPAESKQDVPLSDAMQWGSALGKRACDQLAKEAIRPYDHCPKCTAHMPPGSKCGGPNCPLRK